MSQTNCLTRQRAGSNDEAGGAAACALPAVPAALPSAQALPLSARARLESAAAVLTEQVRVAKAICLATGLPPTMDVLPAIVQALATDYLAASGHDKMGPP
jgi:hypothetical protein